MIYLIKTEDGRFAKIGFTADSVNLRIQSMQTACPLELTCIDAVEGSRNLEKYMHCKCGEFLKNREWFYLTDGLMKIWNKEKNTTELDAERFLSSLMLNKNKPSDYDSKSRVDILVSEEDLKFLGMEAARIGVSRRRYIAMVIEWEVAKCINDRAMMKSKSE